MGQQRTIASRKEFKKARSQESQRIRGVDIYDVVAEEAHNFEEEGGDCMGEHHWEGEYPAHARVRQGERSVNYRSTTEWLNNGMALRRLTV